MVNLYKERPLVVINVLNNTNVINIEITAGNI